MLREQRPRGLHLLGMEDAACAGRLGGLPHQRVTAQGAPPQDILLAGHCLFMPLCPGIVDVSTFREINIAGGLLLSSSMHYCEFREDVFAEFACLCKFSPFFIEFLKLITYQVDKNNVSDYAKTCTFY